MPEIKFKIRASAASQLLGKIGLTDKQQEKYDEYLSRTKALTPTMQKEFNSLKYKKEHPELPQGAKSYCEKWIKEVLYDRCKNFKNKFLDKGIACEPDSILFAAKYYGWVDAKKNDEWFSDEWFEGTPDILLYGYNEVIDMKNSYDAFSFPLFETEIPTEGYDTQLQVYCHLVEYDQGTLCYALMDAPLDIMKQEMRRLSWEQGQQGFISTELYEQVKREMTYSNLPDDLRLVKFTVVRKPEVIELLKERVLMCREYIAKVINERPKIKLLWERLENAA